MTVLKFFFFYLGKVAVFLVSISTGYCQTHLTGDGSFVREGAFRLPMKQLGDSRVAYTQGTFALSSNKKSFFLVGHSHHQAIGEFLVPELVKSSKLSTLNIANVKQPFVTVLGRAVSGNPQKINKITGMKELNGQLIVNGLKYYDAKASVTDTSLIIRDSQNLKGSTVDGYFSLKGRAHAAGWISQVPAEWQDRLGTKLISGFASNYPINSRSSIGPTAFAFYPLALLESDHKDGLIYSEKLMGFSLANPLHPDRYNKTKKNNIWTEVSSAIYGFILPNTNKYLVIGNSGGHTSGIGYKIIQDEGHKCGGPCSYKRSDNYNHFWTWDVNDFIHVREGNKKPHELIPTDFGVFNQLKPDWVIIGADFDEINDLLYVVYSSLDNTQSKYENGPLVVVYSFSSKM
jgi:hypothetical protein